MDALRQAIRDQAVIRDEPLVDDRGNPIPWLVDLRPIFMNPVHLKALASHFWTVVAPREPVQVAGMEVAAIPLLTAILMEAALRGIVCNGLILRKERKGTGRGRQLEGLPTDAPVILVDDILNSGKSLAKALAVLEAEGLTVAKAFVVLDFHTPFGERWRADRGLRVESLFSLPDIGLEGVKAPAPFVSRQYKHLWRFTAPGGSPFYTNPKSAPLWVDGMLIFGTDSAKVYALDAETGKERWVFEAKGAHRKGIWSSAAYHEGLVYIGAYNGVMYALNAQTGEPVWQHQLCEWIGSSPCVVAPHNLLVVGLEYENPTAKGAMVALNLATGAKVWEVKLREYQHGSAVYNPAADTVIFGTNDHTVAAVAARTGTPVWKVQTPRSIKYAPALHAERQLVAVVDFGGNFFLLRAGDGEVVFSFATDATGYTTPLFWQNKVFFGSGNRMFYVVNLDTLLVEHTLDTGARVFASPRLVGQGVYAGVVFGTCGGRLYDIDPSTLETRGIQFLPDAIVNAVVASPDGRHVFVPTSLNEIFAFGRS